MIKEQETIKNFFEKYNLRSANANCIQWKNLQKRLKIVENNKNFAQIIIPDAYNDISQLQLIYKIEQNKYIPLFYVQYIPGIEAYVKPCKYTLKSMSSKQLQNFYIRLYKKEKSIK